MFASGSATSEFTTQEGGFVAPAGVLKNLAMRARLDDMAIFYVVAVALLAAIIVPAWQAAQTTPVVERQIEVSSTAGKSDRLRRPLADIACSGATYGNETVECLVAIVRDSRREPTAKVRIVDFNSARNS